MTPVIITARLYDNPQFFAENVLYDHSSQKYFDFSSHGENIIQVSQVIRIAGKRNKAIELAESNITLNKYQFYDLLRTIRYELRDDFYHLYYARKSFQTFNSQIEFLNKIIIAFEHQKEKGNVSEQEIIRLRSLLYSLQNDQLQLSREIQQNESDLAILIRVPPTTKIIPVFSDSSLIPLPISQFSFQVLLDSAEKNRADLKIAAENINYNEINLRLQNSLAIPDPTFGFSYDKQGNFEHNYNGINISIPIPFFNRNQGNIKTAKAELESSRLDFQSRQDQLQQEVMNSFLQALNIENLLNEMDSGFSQNYAKMMVEIQKNFALHNIGLLEFIDLYDDFRNHLIKLNELKYEQLNAREYINYVTGSSIFNP